MQGVNVEDYDLSGGVVCPVEDLLPGASLTCGAAEPYLVSTVDLTIGSVVNTATAVRQCDERSE